MEFFYVGGVLKRVSYSKKQREKRALAIQIKLKSLIVIWCVRVRMCVCVRASCTSCKEFKKGHGMHTFAIIKLRITYSPFLYEINL